jgi:hypothetical protein
LEVVALLEDLTARVDNIEQLSNKRDSDELLGDGDDESDGTSRQHSKKKQRRTKTPKKLISIELDRLNDAQRAIRGELQVRVVRFVFKDY